VKRQKIKTLEEAFAAVDHLVEHYDEGSNENKKYDEPKEKAMKEETSRLNDKSKTNKPLKCWICEGSHVVKNCPSKPQYHSEHRQEFATISIFQPNLDLLLHQSS